MGRMNIGNPSQAHLTPWKDVIISLRGSPIDEVGHMFNGVCQMEAQEVLGHSLVWYSLVSSGTLGQNYLGDNQLNCMMTTNDIEKKMGSEAQTDWIFLEPMNLDPGQLG